MKSRADIKDKTIRQFLSKISGTLSRLQGLKLKQLDKRIESLQYNISTFSDRKVKAGLIGITSSGKSSLLNILLGTGVQVLKEQSKATTNIVIFCTKSEEPELEINFESGETITKKGEDILSESLWQYTSEDENPRNQLNIKYIKLSLPTFILDSNIEITDTPGLDAYGLKDHEDLTLREFLPQADLVVYFSSIRSPMKDADRASLNRILDADQRAVFVQTCKGAVVDEDYGDAVTESAETQLLHFKESLSKELQPYPRLKKAPVVQVETSQAMQYFRNDDIKTWRESGFEEFTSVISEVINDLGYQFSLLNLRRTVDEVQLLNQILINSFKEKAEKEESLKDQTAYLNELQKICSAIQEDRDRITGVWGNRLLYYPVFRKYKSELSRIYNDIYDFNPSQDRDFIAKVHDLGERAQRLKDSFLNSLDRAKSRYSVRFRELGLDVRRQDLQKIDRTSFFLPNVQKKSRLEKLAEPDHAVHFSGLSLWNDNGTDGEDKYFDQTRYYEDLKESLKNFFEPLLKHLQWWEQTVNYTFIEPLQKKIQTLKEDEETILAGIEIDESSFEELSNISTELEAAANSVAGLCGIDPLKHRVDKYAGYAQKAELQKHGAVDSNLFADIYKRISENQFHGYYLSCLSELSVSKDKQILIITQGYSSTVNFLRRLLRLDNDQLALLSEIKPPFCINVQDSIPELYNIEIKGDLQNSLSFYILGNDIESYDAAEVYDLFEKSDIIQVMIEDLHRVGSAATDLTERNIFLTAMNRYCKKLLMTYPKAAYFQGERLHILVNEAVAEINSIFSITSLQWFIYENFEVRYSQFNRLTSEAGYKIDPESFIKEWKKRLIPLDAPFDETLLRKQVKELTNG